MTYILTILRVSGKTPPISKHFLQIPHSLLSYGVLDLTTFVYPLMSINLRQNVPVDDTDSHIAYSSGDWQVYTGSTRQWEGAVHGTDNPGATVAFSFQGEAFIVHTTLPGGGGNVVADISVDGGAPTRINQACGTDSVYMNVFYQSSIMTFKTHTVVITNRGTTADPLLMFDEVTLYAQDIVPSMNDPPTVSQPTTSSSSSSSSSTQKTSSTSQTPQPAVTGSGTTGNPSGSSASSTKSTENTSISSSAPSTSGSATSTHNSTSLTSSTTVVQTSTSTSFSTDSTGGVSTIVNVFTTSVVQPVQTGLNISPEPSHSSSSVSIGVIVGSVLGGLALFVLCLIAFLLLRRRRRDGESHLKDSSFFGRNRALKPHEPEPFRVSAPPHAQNHPYPINDSRPFMSNEKSLRMHQSADRLGGPSTSPEPSSSGDAYGSVAASTSAATLLERGQSGSAQPLGTSQDTHQRSHSDTTSSSMYASPLTVSGDEVPPPYQPSITTRLADYKS